MQRKLYIPADVADNQIQRPNLDLDLGKDVLGAVLIAGIQRIAIGPAPSVGNLGAQGRSLSPLRRALHTVKPPEAK